jgi:hypothetical protein
MAVSGLGLRKDEIMGLKKSMSAVEMIRSTCLLSDGPNRATSSASKAAAQPAVQIRIRERAS